MKKIVLCLLVLLVLSFGICAYADEVSTTFQVIVYDEAWSGHAMDGFMISGSNSTREGFNTNNDTVWVDGPCTLKIFDGMEGSVSKIEDGKTFMDYYEGNTTSEYITSLSTFGDEYGKGSCYLTEGTYIVFVGTGGDHSIVRIVVGNKAPEQEIKILFEGEYLEMDQPPVIVNGRTLVPVRVIFEAVGMEVLWDESDQSVIARGQGNEVIMLIGNPSAMVNGLFYTLDVPPQLINSRTLVPVRFLTESLGYIVDWDEATQTVIVKKHIIQ